MFNITNNKYPNAVCRIFDVNIKQSIDNPESFSVNVMYQLFSDNTLSYNFLSSRKLLSKEFSQSELDFVEYEKELQLEFTI